MTERLTQVLVDITIAAPVEAVWTALRDPERIEQWFGWDAPGLADEIRAIFVDGAEGDAARRVVQFDAWEGEGIDERVVLEPVPGGTSLRLIRSGGAPIDWTGVYEDISQGWITFFEQMRLALAMHPNDRRKTIYLSGAARPGSGEPAAALGLGRPGDYRPGQPYAATLATGDVAEGVAWYTTHFQTGLVVEQWNNGLIAVTDKGVSPKRPQGGGSVLLTTYGFSNADFAALERRWLDWWSQHYVSPAG